MLERFSLMLAKAFVLGRDGIKREEGQTVVEYGLVLAFVAIALLAILVVLKGGITQFINAVNTQIASLPGF